MKLSETVVSRRRNQSVEAIRTADRLYSHNYRLRNPEKVKATRERYVANNKESYIQYHREYYQKQKALGVKQKQWYFDLKKGLSCKNCPENHPACLQFHHRDPAQKLFNIGGDRKSKAVMLAEIAKCDVLCSNCHFKLHAQPYRSVA